ncbi:MAG: glycosyltransferase family 87 protein [Gemmatimonadota bacterium]
MTDPRRKIDWILILALVCSIGLVAGAAEDFRVYYDAGVRFLSGGWTRVYEGDVLTPFKYHPLFLLLSLPFSVLPWFLAKILWATLNGFWIGDGARRFQRAFGLADRHLLVGFLFVIHALSWQLKFGNVTFLILWLLALSVSRRPAIAGGASGLMILLKPFWAPFLLLAVLARRNRTLLAMLGVICGLSLLPLLFGGTSAYADWFGTLADATHAHNYPKNDNQGLYAIAFRNRATLGDLTNWMWFVGSCLSGIGWVLTVLSVDEDRFELGALAMVPFILWAAPLSWIHHQIWLWPVFAVVLKKPNWALLAVVWLLLNGTGDLFWSREWFSRLHQWGLPTLAFPLTQILFFQYIRTLHRETTA